MPEDFASRLKHIRIQGQELAENTKEMLNMIYPALWLLDRYHHPFFVVYTNTLPGKVVYEDEYQVAVEVSGEINITPIPKHWDV